MVRVQGQHQQNPNIQATLSGYTGYSEGPGQWRQKTTKQQLGPQGASSSKESDGTVNRHVCWKQKLYNCQSQIPKMQGPQPNPSTKTRERGKGKGGKRGRWKGEEEEKREVRRKIGKRKWGAARGRGRREQCRQGQEQLQKTTNVNELH